MLKLIAAMTLCGTQVGAQDLDPPLGHLFAPCKMGLGALYQLEADGAQASPEVRSIGGAVRFYMIGLAHGRYGATDPDGFAKVYYYFFEQCDKDNALRIEAIGSGM